MNRFSELNTLHFRVDISAREAKPEGWEVSGQIIRNDTGEYVQGGATVFAKDKVLALNKLYVQLKASLENMDVPYDWKNPDKVRLVINRYVQYNEQLTNKYMSLENELENNSLTQDTLYNVYHELRKTVTSTTIDISRELTDFSEEAKIKLMTPDKSIYQDIMNPWNLDELYAREALFEYLINPSDAVKNAHKDLRNKMISAFEGTEKD